LGGAPLFYTAGSTYREKYSKSTKFSRREIQSSRSYPHTNNLYGLSTDAATAAMAPSPTPPHRTPRLRVEPPTRPLHRQSKAPTRPLTAHYNSASSLATPIPNPAGTPRVRIADPAPTAHPLPFARKFTQLISQTAHSFRYTMSQHDSTSSSSSKNDGRLTSRLEDPTDLPSNDTRLAATPNPIAHGTPTANSTRTFDKRPPNPAPT
jgi:hypothetical protein